MRIPGTSWAVHRVPGALQVSYQRRAAPLGWERTPLWLRLLRMPPYRRTVVVGGLELWVYRHD